MGHLRANPPGRRARQSPEGIVRACRDAWNRLIADPVHVSSITTHKWASLTSQGRRHDVSLGWSDLFRGLRDGTTSS